MTTIEHHNSVGYINDNKLLNVGLSNEQVHDRQAVYILHCLSCHQNCVSYQSALGSRKCPHCGTGKQGWPMSLTDADRQSRCGREAHL